LYLGCFRFGTKAVVVSATRAVVVSGTRAVFVSAAKAVFVSVAKIVLLSSALLYETMPMVSLRACGVILSVFLVTACSAGDDDDGGLGTDGDAGPDITGDAGPLGPDATDWNATFEEVLPDDHVVEIELDLADGDWVAMLEEWTSQRTKSYYPSAFAHDAERLPNIGVRLKGYSSLLFGAGGQFGSTDPGAKWPLKLNFNKFGGERFQRVDRLNLGNNVFDASYMRERLGSRVFAAMGVPVARAAFANVTVDEQYLGVYTMNQQVDSRFLRQHFGEESDAFKGNLYKCVPNESDTCTLTWKGGDPSTYHHTHSCNEGYEECGIVLKTNQDDPLKNDYQDLVQFLDILNNTPDQDFADAIEQVFDVDSFLRLAATNVVLSSFDSYFGRVNNFYLYHRPDTDKFMMIPWDLNMTYGLYGCRNGSMISFDIDTPKCSDAGDIPLSDRIMAVPQFHDTYMQYVKEVAEIHLAEAKQQQWINEFDALIGPLIGDDPNYPNSVQRYRDSLGDTRHQFSLQEGYNLMDFAKRRREFVLSQFP
tara:strand:- start:65744 stop:67348 length:1605 start_codon:yes stop_codon:yes gene_type:complete